MARQREARAANAGEDRKQLEWVQESRKDAKKGLKNLYCETQCYKRLFRVVDNSVDKINLGVFINISLYIFH